MEMVASAAAPIAHDLTTPIPPIAAALHPHFLPTHCSACFRRLPASPTPCPSCPLLYCSPGCSAADSPLHTSSDCRRLPSPSSASLRAALRLLRSLSSLGLARVRDRRLGGLLVGGGEGGADVEAAIAAVERNGVEVEVGGEGAVGVAVYGPRFSWFNHSCSPNACFRFEIGELPAGFGQGVDVDGVAPAGTDATAVATTWESWIAAERRVGCGLSWYGPRIVVRSIKPIKEGEEVCIAYTDLLQPKAMRHSDLWSKYDFVCCCERCSSSPETYIDHVLSCTAQDLNSEQYECTEIECEEQANCLDQAITRYMSDGNPKVCRETLEVLLRESFQDKQFPAEKPSQRKFVLHPLHYLSLNAYLTLASTYRIQANDFLACQLGEKDISEAFNMSKTAAAYSLLLVGAAHHLFLRDSSLIASVSLYVVSAGESILHFVRSPMWDSSKTTNGAELCFISCFSLYSTTDSFLTSDKLKATSMIFVECLSRILVKSWPFLVQGIPYLESVKNAINFSWLGSTENTFEVLRGTRGLNFGDEVFFRCNYTAGIGIQEEMGRLIQLAFHCLLYGKYLASICYGPRCYLTEHAEDLLHDIRQIDAEKSSSNLCC